MELLAAITDGGSSFIVFTLMVLAVFVVLLITISR